MTQFNIPFLRFFGLSLATHALLLGYLSALPKMTASRRSEPAPITVSMVRPDRPEVPRGGSAAATEVSKTPAKVAERDTPIPSRTEVRPRAAKLPEKAQPRLVEKSASKAESTTVAKSIYEDQAGGLPVPTTPVPQKDPSIERSGLTERRLPSVKDLLPPLTYSSSEGRGNAPISLNTRDPAYVSYFNRIKQAIELNWEYPELAKRYGLQGKLSVEFTVGADGQLERLRLLRSSGSQLLDDEALRAIKAAAPFPRIPTWIKGSQLPISASMEYSDSRLNYREAR